MPKSPNERSPLLAAVLDDPTAPSLGTRLFPFHPRAPTTPLWRKLFLLHFDGHRNIHELREDDVWPLESQFHGERAAADLKKHLPKHGRWRLLRAACAVNRRRLVVAAGLRLFTVGFSVLRSLLLYRLVTDEGDRQRDLVLLAGITLVRVALSFVTGHMYQVETDVVFQAYNGLYRMITDRLINVGSAAATSATATSTAEITSIGHKERVTQTTKMLVNDLSVLEDFMMAVTSSWSSILKLASSIVVLALVVDISQDVLWRVGVVYVCVLVIELLLVRPLVVRAESSLVHRLSTVHECLKGIQMIKLNSWEDKMEAKIMHARNKERTAANRLHTISLILEQVIDDSPMLFAAVAFGITQWSLAPSSESMTTQAKPFTPVRVFTVLVLFNDCLQSARFLKYAALMSLTGFGAWQRAESLLLDENNGQVVGSAEKNASVASAPLSKSTIVVEMHNARLSSPPIASSTPTMLLNVEWQIHRGDLVVVHGAAGVGKSMLLAAIRQDRAAVNVSRGSLRPVSTDWRIAYCSQDPWLQALTIRDNILFGTAFVEDKYWSVVDACGLLEDLSVLPAGDATLVGPRGINLSSGQCARIALARACYADADLYLLDTPLANVDAVVQSEIFRKCIVELLMYKTVVIVTHNPEYIGSSFVDQLVHVQPLSVHVANRISTRKPHDNKPVT